MTRKIKVLFLLPSLNPGGAERVISFLAQNIDKSYFEPQLLILYSSHKTDYLIEGIPYHYLNKSRSLTAIPGIIRTINNFKPNIVFTSIIQLNQLGGVLNLLYKDSHFIGREASIPSYRNNNNFEKLTNHSFIKTWPYRKLSAIVCQSLDMAKDMQENYGVKNERITIIGNPVTLPGIKKIKRNKIPHLITIGRLTKVKGQLRLLSILSKLDFDFYFTIIGDGEKKETILNSIESLGLKSNTTYIPYTSNVSSYLSKADLYIQGSYVEGFPNALLESCAVGVPVVAFNAPGGTKEIVVEGVNGFVVDTEVEFKIKIEKALFSHEWFSDKIIASVINKFKPEIIINKYEELFKSLAEKTLK